MWAATSTRSSATWWRAPWPWSATSAAPACAPRPRRPPRSASWTPSTGPGATAARDSFRKKLRAGELDDKEVELQLADTGGGGMFEIPGQPGASVLNLSEMMKSFGGGGRTKTHKTTVIGAWAPLIAEESDKLLDQEALTQEALELAENHGIVFLDEIDKVASSEPARGGADVSSEGVQRDLLPLIEGTTVSTKYGPVKTDHILFIASGAFHVAKPSDLLPELQGRLPIRVELKGLSRDDLRRILTEPEANLIRQHQALLLTEGVTLVFSEDAIDAVADAAVAVNSLGREHRRLPPADHPGEGGRGDQLLGRRPLRRDGDRGRRLREEPHRRPGGGRGPEPVHL